jgi:hypothetical protein
MLLYRYKFLVNVICVRKNFFIFENTKHLKMKKLTLLLGAALIMGTTAFAGDGNKGCCKGKKEACATEKKTACEKGKGCCKKGEGKASASNAEVKKAPTKEAKATPAPKKS